MYFYDVNTGEEAVPKEDSSDEAFFGVCMYHKDVQPSPPAGKCMRMLKLYHKFFHMNHVYENYARALADKR